jgi:hypothetical protein
LGIQPQLEIAQLDDATFRANPAESNRIWIDGRPMEEWLQGRVGSSRCCSVCGESECRTVEVRGTSFEVIPKHLILKAALIASAGLLEDTPGSDSAWLPVWRLARPVDSLAADFRFVSADHART